METTSGIYFFFSLLFPPPFSSFLIIITNIKYSFSATLKKHFEKYGGIREAVVMRFPSGTSRYFLLSFSFSFLSLPHPLLYLTPFFFSFLFFLFSSRFGFVTFTSEESVIAVLADSHVIEGKTVRFFKTISFLFFFSFSLFFFCSSRRGGEHHLSDLFFLFSFCFLSLFFLFFPFPPFFKYPT